MEKLAVIILAAGKGSRMKKDLPKVLSLTSRGPLINLVLDTATKLEPESCVIVTGYKAELVEEAVKQAYPKNTFQFARQAQQLGTGDAVRAALDKISNHIGTVLILSGDVPLISEGSLLRLLNRHSSKKATVSVLTFTPQERDNSYGRIIRGEDGSIKAIREKADCSDKELLIQECNSGIYAVDSAFLAPAIKDLKNDNKQGEYYLTDIIERAVNEGQTVIPHLISNEAEVLGINTPSDLHNVNNVLRLNRNRALLNEGVDIIDPQSTFIDETVQIAVGAQVGPNTIIKGKTIIETKVIIEGNSFINDSVIKESALIKFNCRIDEAVIESNCFVGPFAHLRPGSTLKENSRVGNFVETKDTILGKNSKANHLTYLGNSTIGENCNIGAGTITCNYDGVNKHKTIIGKQVFVGSNSSLVAPVTIEDNSTIAAGSVITKTVEANSLGIGRSRQINKSGWKRKS